MKKIIVFLVSLLLIFCLPSCNTVNNGVNLSQDRANVQSVEIYNPDRAYYEGNIHNLLEENDPVATLESENFASFLDVLCDLEFEKEKSLFPIPADGGYDYDGYIIAVVYSDGGYDIIAEGGLYSYAIGSDGQGRHKYDHSNYCGETLWIEFIEEYIVK